MNKTEMFDFSTVLSCVIFGSHWFSFLFCGIGKRQTTGTVCVLAEPSPWPLPTQSTVPVSRLPGAGILASHFCSSGGECMERAHGQARTLNCPVTMGSEEWERKCNRPQVCCPLPRLQGKPS